MSDASEGVRAPLVPADVDLRGYEYMPLYADRLFSSETWIKAPAEGKVAALRLWTHAFLKESPAASLPDDDVLLSEYAGYGVAVKTWKKIRPAAMRGWAMCSNGRLYHQVLADIAMLAWDARQESRNEQERKERHRRERSELFAFLRDRGVVPPLETSIATLRETAKGLRWNVPEDVPRTSGGTARSEGKRSEAKVSELSDRDVERTPDEDPSAGKGKIAMGKIAQGKGNGSGQDWNSAAWVAATATTLGLHRIQGEADDLFRDRVFAAVQEKRRATA